MRFAALAAIGVCLAVAGCGDDPESDPLAPERAPEGGIPADGLSQDDAAMARAVARYLDRNTNIEEIDRVSVRRGVITVHTKLVLSGRVDGDARAICDLIQGSDEADLTPGHTVRGRGPAVTCPHRTG